MELLQEMDEEDVDGLPLYSEDEFRVQKEKSASHVIKFFVDKSNLLLSALVEDIVSLNRNNS